MSETDRAFRLMACIAAVVPKEKWAELQEQFINDELTDKDRADLAKRRSAGAEDEDDPDNSPGSSPTGGTSMGNEDFMASMHRDAVVSSGMRGYDGKGGRH